MDENGEGLKFVKTRQMKKKEHGQERARGVKILIFFFLSPQWVKPPYYTKGLGQS